MNRLLFFILTFSFLIFFSCNSNETGKAKDVNPEAIYFDYKIWGEEGKENLTVKLQYRFGGEDGTTLLLEEPSKVELDGEILIADSSKITGVYYEVQKPVASFAGKHSIIFTDINKKQYREIFSFQPFRLETKLNDTLHRDQGDFKLKGLDPEDYLTVLLTDTSFSGEGINRMDTVYNGRLFITKEEMYNLANGPVQLEFIKESEKPVRNGTREGGRISISFTLRREFILKD